MNNVHWINLLIIIFVNQLLLYFVSLRNGILELALSDCPSIPRQISEIDGWNFLIQGLMRDLYAPLVLIILESCWEVENDNLLINLGGNVSSHEYMYHPTEAVICVIAQVTMFEHAVLPFDPIVGEDRQAFKPSVRPNPTLKFTILVAFVMLTF